MAVYDEFYQARSQIIEILEKELIGPVSSDEVLDELPLQYYATGKLFPASGAETTFFPEITGKDDTLEKEGDGDAADSITPENMARPSSAGITFAVPGSCGFIAINVSYAFYVPEMPEKSQKDEKSCRGKTHWRRKEFAKTLHIPLRNSRSRGKKLNFHLEHGIRLHLLARPETGNGERILTAALINKNAATGEPAADSALCAFQISLRADIKEERSGFVPLNRHIPVGIDEEVGLMDMLYAHALTWAQGHGCSAEWDMENESPLWVATSFLPRCATLQMKSPSEGLDDVLDMQTIAQGDRKKVVSGLGRIADAYGKWIDKLEKRNVDATYSSYAKNSIKKCREACARIRTGIECLAKDDLVFRAFRLANEAMMMQHERVAIKAGKKPIPAAWRLFQLAFFLHEISSFAQPECTERKDVDLLWFPTGGGKTEAYLGIAAFAIFLRRLRNPQDNGVTVIMRYTLRLLTLQQFERASLLIFVCDILRQRHFPGTPEIAIGFWVGEAMTPNKLDAARKAHDAIINGAPGQWQSPCLLKKCPWCGSILVPADYSFEDENKGRMLIRCPNDKCHFSRRDMPVHLIDDCIYAHLPAFLLATVDKFAQIPLQEKTGRILGAGVLKNPPDLIIQDELHLISGPLGTMTGIYETAFQKICERNGIPPKVIASTATIRNAAAQILSLYGRQHTQFPPAGLSMKDSFFAVEASPDELPARLYAGVMGEWITTTTMLIRINAALLFATRYLAVAGYSDEVIDNFWTLTGYFNSLRELGGAYVTILDDVGSRFSYLAGRKFAVIYPGVDPNTVYENILELTSRKDSADLPTEIARIERQWKKESHADVYDFVLASNMISVGVDVGRLGLMTILGQPKTSAEYIQASSRVGRRNPGLVITIYNPRRSRDRSHFEQFMRFHASLYRYVEATSLTPFSDRARDRGLQALFIALCRCLVPSLAGDRDAASFDPDSPDVRNIMKFICDYVSRVDPEEKNAVEEELEKMAGEWKSRADLCGQGFLYRYRKNAPGWLIKEDMTTDRFRMMNSLRSVEAQSSVYILGENQ